MKNLLVSLGLSLFASITFAQSMEWTEIEQVRITDRKTAIAIQNCKVRRAADFRCNDGKNYKCGACSEVSHSDESIYVVYQLLANGGRGGRDDRGGWGRDDRRDDRGGWGRDDRGGWGRDDRGRDDRGGWGRGRDDRGGWGRDDRGRDDRGRGPRAPERRYEETKHFRHDKTAQAYAECVRQRASNPQCSSQNFECTPCTVESHTDHSQYEIYKIVR